MACDRKRLLLVLLCGGAGIAGGLWAQARFWPRPPKWTPPEAADPGLPASAIDWKNPPLPPETRVAFPLVRETAAGVQAQYMCETSRPPREVCEFYRSQLARDGWAIYNVAEPGGGAPVAGAVPGPVAARGGKIAASLLFRRRGADGRRSCWITVFEGHDGRTAFRVAVLPSGR